VVTASLAAKVRCKEARRILRKRVGVSVASLVPPEALVALLSSVLEAQAARVRRERLVTVLALAVLVGTLALVARAAILLAALVLWPVLVVVAVVGVVMPQPVVAVAAVVSAYLVRAQRALAVPLAVVVVLAVLAVLTVLQQPQMQERRVAHTAVAVAALMMTAI
jgi:hypothetical protein